MNNTAALALGSSVSVFLAGTGPVVGFYHHTGSLRNFVKGAYVQTATGRYPVRLARGTSVVLGTGTVALVG